jgi:hypothetical protein
VNDQDMPPPKPKLSSMERRARDADRLAALRLRMAIGRVLEERGIEAAAEMVGAVLGIPAHEAEKLLIRRQWREGDVRLLETAATRLGASTTTAHQTGPERPEGGP